MILRHRRRIDDVPITLTQATGYTKMAYYSQPVDDYFFERYKVKHRMPHLTRRVSMPVSQYADELVTGRTVNDAMTPDRVCDLLCDLAREGLAAAKDAQAADRAETREELGRFMSDSEMYVLATNALRHKVQAAILKGRILKGATGRSWPSSKKKCESRWRSTRSWLS